MNWSTAARPRAYRAGRHAFSSFADPAVLERDEAAVLVHPVDDSYRWCTATSDAQGIVEQLHDKQAGLPGPVDGADRRLLLSSPERIAAGLSQAMAAAEAGVTAEMADILNNVPRERPIRAVRAGDWLDWAIRTARPVRIERCYRPALSTN